MLTAGSSLLLSGRSGAVDQGFAQIAAGDRFGIAQKIAHRAMGHQPAAVDAAARPQIDDIFGPPDGLLVVFDHHHGVALGLEMLEGFEQHGGVAGVQTDGRLIQDIADAAQVGAQLGGEADALGLAAAQGGGGPVEGEIIESHLFQELEPRDEFAGEIAGDCRLTAVPGEAG